jgi:hypothetical protein
VQVNLGLLSQDVPHAASCCVELSSAVLIGPVEVHQVVILFSSNRTWKKRLKGQRTWSFTTSIFGSGLIKAIYGSDGYTHHCRGGFAFLDNDTGFYQQTD